MVTVYAVRSTNAGRTLVGAGRRGALPARAGPRPRG